MRSGRTTQAGFKPGDGATFVYNEGVQAPPNIGYVHKFLLPLPSFWPTWSILTVASAAFTAWFVPLPACQVVGERSQRSGPRRHWSRGSVLSLALLALFLAGYIAMMLVREDFSWYDDSQFTFFTLRGSDFAPPVWLRDGRFWPLGLQEFNLIRHFTRTAAGYQALPIIEVLVFALVLLIPDNRISISGRAALITVALTTPSVLSSFMGLIYPERNLLLLLVCLVWFVRRFEESHKTRWAAAAVLCCQFMLYLKEPVSLLLLSFAATRLILRSGSFKGAVRNLHSLRDEESRLDLCVAAISVAFLAIYAVMRLRSNEVTYLVSNKGQLTEALYFYLRIDVLAWLLTAVVLVRMYRIVRGKSKYLPLWDALACGGVAYFVVYLALHIHGFVHYLAPADLIAVLYLGYIVLSSWGAMRRGIRIATALLVTIVVCVNLDVSVLLTLSRKYLIHQKAAIAGVILRRYERDPALVRKLFFPFSDTYDLSEFAAYLSYRGVPVEEIGHSAGGPSVEIFGAKANTDGPCVEYRPFVCRAGSYYDAGSIGSMTVLLPDDFPLPEETGLFTEQWARLQAADPWAHVPPWLIWMPNSWRRRL